MKFYPYCIFACLSLLHGCANFEDKELTKRSTFARFYGNDVSYLEPIVEVDITGGYILSTTIPKEDSNSDALLIKTDEDGKTLWQVTLENSAIRAIKPLSNGYLLLRDRIEINVGVPQTEIVNTKISLLEMDLQGNISKEFIKSETTTAGLEIDFHGDGIHFDETGDILLLGSFVQPDPNSYQTSFTESIDPLTFSSNWSQTYSLLERDYENCRVLHVTPDQNLLWASSASISEQNSKESYASISYVKPNSTFENNSKFGENDSRRHIVADIRKSIIGFGMVGTYSETNGQNANIFFLRVNNTGGVVAGSERYFDGHSETLLQSDRDDSGNQDEGNALTGTQDGGFVLACTVSSTPDKGNGGTDIRIIKLNAFGDILWTELIGGPGDERANAIRETADGHLLIAGTNTLNGLSSIVLLKLNDTGSLSE